PAQLLRGHVIHGLPPYGFDRPVQVCPQLERHRDPRREVEALPGVPAITIEMCAVNTDPDISTVVPGASLPLELQAREFLKGVILILNEILIICRLAPQEGMPPRLDPANP